MTDSLRSGFSNITARAFREPLVHFLIAGAAIFLLFSGAATDAGDRRIVITEAQVARLATQWAQTWRRPPSPQELDGLIRDYVKEEVYYREGLRLGLDKDDPVIRRRIRSKMEFLATSEAENAAPTEAELQAWLDRNPDRYALDPAYSFDQIYVDAQGGDAPGRARALLAQLRASPKTPPSGDPISLPARMEGAVKQDVERQFGADFAGALARQPVGGWAGPVVSGFGLHLVRVRSVKAAHRPTLSEVRRQVENDWLSESRARREAEAYQTLLDGYDIRIGTP